MYIDYTTVSDTSKVWVYPSNRKFYTTEIDELNEKIMKFLEGWKSEDENFKASYRLLYNRFIVLFADVSETTLLNADIDASVQFILQLQQEYDVELLDRMNVCFKQGEYVQYKDLKDFKKLLKNKAVTGKTIVFDNLITTKGEFENYWEVPITESWYSRFLK